MSTRAGSDDGAAAVAAPAPRPFLYSFGFLLFVTVATGILAELAFDALRETGFHTRLPALAVIVVPPALSGLVAPWLLIRFVYGSTLREFGVRWIDPDRPMGPWLLGSSVLALVVWLAFWGLVCGALLWATRSAPDRVVVSLAELHAKNPLHAALHDEPTARRVATVLHMTVLVGFVEELFGRGLLQNALDRRYTRVLGRGRFTIRVSTILAAVLFAFWHTQWLAGPGAIAVSAAIALTIVLLPALLLGIVYEKTRSMLAVILLHDVIDGGKLVTWYVWSWILPG